MAKNTIEVKLLGDNKDLASKLGDSESKISKFASGAGKLLAAGFAVAGAAGAAALTKGFSDFIGAEAGVDLLQGSLGISEQAAAELGGAASAVYRDAWGSSLSEVQGFVGNLSSSFEGLGVDEIEGLTPKAIALGDAFGIDVAGGIQTASELVSSGLASSADEAFDLLTVGLQKMPAGIREELLAASDEYGDFFADLGFSGDEAFALLTNAAEDGVYGIDKTGDALKELSIRATDMSTASVDAFKAAGLNAEDMAGQFLAGGDVARGALDKTIEGLLSIEDPVEQSNAAIALFGSPLEDLSVSEIPTFLDSLNDMSGGMGDVGGAAEDLADTIGGNTAAKIEAFKREALGKLADFVGDKVIPVIERLTEWLGDKIPPIVADLRRAFDDNWPKIQATIKTVVDWVETNLLPKFKTAFDAVVDGFRAVVDFFDNNRNVLITVLGVITGAFVLWGIAAAVAAGATLLAVSPIILLVAAVAAIAGALVYAYENFEGFRNVVDAVVEFLTDTVWPAIQAFADFVGDVFTATVGFIRTHWDTIQSVIEGVWDFVKKYVENAIKIVQGVIQTVTGIITGDWGKAWDGIKQIFSGVWDQIKHVVSTAIDIVKSVLSAAWDVIKSVLSSAWDAMKRKVSDTINGIVDYVRALPGRARDALSSVFTTLTGKGKDLITGLWNGMIEKFNAARAWVGEIPGKVLGAIGGVFTLLGSVGANIISGLWNGMKSKWNEVTGWVRDRISSLSSIAKTVLGINSPSKVFAKIGEGVGEGMVMGLDSMTGKVQNAASKMMPSASDLAASVEFVASRLPVKGSHGANVSASGASQTIHFNNYGSEFTINDLSRGLAMAEMAR